MKKSYEYCVYCQKVQRIKHPNTGRHFCLSCRRSFIPLALQSNVIRRKTNLKFTRNVYPLQHKELKLLESYNLKLNDIKELLGVTLQAIHKFKTHKINNMKCKRNPKDLLQSIKDVLEVHKYIVDNVYYVSEEQALKLMELFKDDIIVSSLLFTGLRELTNLINNKRYKKIKCGTDPLILLKEVGL